MQGQGRPSPGGAPSSSFCIPADGVHCRGCRWDPDNGICTRPDCSALFTPPAVREQQRSWPHDEQPQLVIAAGPERSGSTFLYNALRLLWQHARKSCDAYYLKVRVTGMESSGVFKQHALLVVCQACLCHLLPPSFLTAVSSTFHTAVHHRFCPR